MDVKGRSLAIGFGLALLLGSAVLITRQRANAAEPDERRYAGRAEMYRNLDEQSLEQVSTRESVLAATAGSMAPMRVWRTLEHAEELECLDCIPKVAKLLYNENAKTREISAWWLRRRIFGVFGKGEVYSQVVDTLNDKSKPEHLRAYAANALGEFLTAAGIKHVAKAAVEDPAPVVRVASVRALERLNHQGPNVELATALGDSNEDVRLAALSATTHVHVFSKPETIAARIEDSSALVRRRAAQALGSLRVKTAGSQLITLTSPDREPDPSVRAAAVWALGQLADSSARAAVSTAENDPDRLVRDAARIALRRL